VSGIPTQDGSSYFPDSTGVPLQQIAWGKDLNGEMGVSLGTALGSTIGAIVFVTGIDVGISVTEADTVLLQAATTNKNAALKMLFRFIMFSLHR
jgi:hypothetical protein